MKRLLALHYASIVSLIALIFVCLLWETWLAPLKSGGSVLMLKALPLLFPLFGILRGRVYTYQWAPMLVLIYLTEGLVRGWSESGPSAHLAYTEAALATLFFFSSMFYVKGRKRLN